MTFEARGEYYFDGGPNFHNTVYLPAEETDDWAKRLNKKGIYRFIRVTLDGEVSDEAIWEVPKDNPYSEALQTISALESQGHLKPGSYHEAIDMLAEDEFDSSVWATYMPRPTAE